MLRKVQPRPAPPPFLRQVLPSIDVLQQGLTGATVPAKIGPRTFDIYESKSLILELPGGQPPAPPNAPPAPITPYPLPVSKDQYLVINDYAMLEQIHRPHHIYRLLPRRARNNQAYICLKEICALPGSPFMFNDRIDTHSYRLTLRADAQEVVKGWNEGLDAKAFNFNITPNSSIGFDGMLLGETEVGLLLNVPVLNEKAVSTITGSVEFLRQYVNMTNVSKKSNIEFDVIWQDVFRRRKIHCFLAGDRPPTRDALGFAKVKGVHMFTKVGRYYRFVS